MAFSAPEPLTNQHDASEFDCGDRSLSDWLRRYAKQNARGHNARTYVACDGQVVAGYYCLSASSITKEVAATDAARGAPRQIPAMLIGRLAVDNRYSRQGLGRSLLLDALERVLNISQQAGVRLVLVHPIDEDARRFWRNFGFQPSPLESENVMMLMVKDVARSIAHLR